MDHVTEKYVAHIPPTLVGRLRVKRSNLHGEITTKPCVAQESEDPAEPEDWYGELSSSENGATPTARERWFLCPGKKPDSVVENRG